MERAAEQPSSRNTMIAADAPFAAAPMEPPQTVAQALGDIAWLLSRSPGHRFFSLADLEWLAMPPILLQQFRIFRGDRRPVGLVLWAELSEESEHRFNAAALSGDSARLRPNEWRSGDRAWLVELVAPFATPESKLREAMLADLVHNVFPGRRLKFHAVDAVTGKRTVKEIGG